MKAQPALPFELCEIVGPECLARHPAWGPFGDAGDRALLVEAGVSPDALDSALARFDDCGPSLWFPLPIRARRLPARSSAMVAARFTTAGGQPAGGWVMEPHAFGLFTCGGEFAFNRTLPRGVEARVQALARALDADPEGVFPLRFETGLLRADGSELAGSLEAPTA